MQPFAQRQKWPLGFIATVDNSTDSYAAALIQAFDRGDLDIALVMPEALLFHGLVDQVAAAGYGDKIIGLDQQGAFLEADKIAGKELCAEAGIPVAPWTTVNARDYRGLNLPRLSAPAAASSNTHSAGARRGVSRLGNPEVTTSCS
jgi:phosphoribosylamine-glycine ligase